MIAFILTCSILILIVLEWISLNSRFRRMRVQLDADMTLVEPEEIITLRYTVQNVSSLPILSAGFSLQFTDAVKLAESPEWEKRYATRDVAGLRIHHRMYLLPHRQFRGKVHLKLNDRGMHELGRYYLEMGDLLGLRQIVHSDDIGISIVCTAAAAPAELTRTLGGFLGDVSVRRFLHEDPGMISGYRDYTGREPMKQISWMATAKAGHLMVRQQDHTTDQTAMILVNMDRTGKGQMEQLMQLVRGTCELLESRKIPYALRSNGDLFSLPEGLGRTHLHTLLRRIGLSRLVGYHSFESLLQSCTEERITDTSLIILTPDPFDETVETSYQSLLDELRIHSGHPVLTLDADI